MNWYMDHFAQMPWADQVQKQIESRRITVAKTDEKVEALAKVMFYRHQRFATAGPADDFTPAVPWGDLEDWAHDWWLDLAREVLTHLGCKDGVVPDVQAAVEALRVARNLRKTSLMVETQERVALALRALTGGD